MLGRCAAPSCPAAMVLLTMIARVADGLPLAASMQEDEQVGFRQRAGPAGVPGRGGWAVLPVQGGLGLAGGCPSAVVLSLCLLSLSLRSPAATCSSTRARRSSCSAG